MAGELSSLEFLAVNGGAIAVKEYLVEHHKWDDESPRALVSLRLGHGGIIRSSGGHLLSSQQH